MQFKPFKIGKYLLLERLATGGMAEVYRAKASGAGGFEKQLAIKRIIPTYSENNEFRRMFEYEARLSSLLNHANIVHVYDFVKSGETYLLAMEFVDGKNLRQVVNKAKKRNLQLPIDFGAYVINEVCKGLDYAHKLKDGYQGKHLNVIHRDMSPQNIMLAYEGAIKIVDFGIAKARDRVDETRSGVIKGKFGYMSPEQASGQEIDHRSDIFSTCIILYELLTNRRLFASENDMQTLKRIQECIVQRPSLINPKVNTSLEKIILKGLTKDPSLRYQQAGELHQKLQEYLNKYHPTFTQNHVIQIMEQLFRTEIVQEKQRLEQVYRQSIPYSRGALNEHSLEEQLPDELDGNITKSEHEPDSLVTKVSELSEISKPEPPPEKSSSTDPEKTPKQLQTPITSKVEEKTEPPPSTTPTLDKTAVADFTKEYFPDDEESQSFTPSPSHTNAPQAKSVSVTQPKAPETEPPENQDTGASTSAEQPPSISSFTKSKSQTSKKVPTTTSKPTSKEPIYPEQKIELTLEPTFQAPNTRQGLEPSDPSPPKSQSYSKPPPPRPKRHSPPASSLIGRALSSAVILTALAGTLYYYFSIEEPLQAPAPQIARDTSNVPKKTPSPSRATSKPTQPSCPNRVDSDPRGASIYVDGNRVGRTPMVVAFACNKKLALTLQLDGYERIQEFLTFRQNRPLKLYRTLKKLPLGRLRLTLSQNARLFINGRAHPKEISANTPITIWLKAGVTHQLRFENPTLGLAVEKKYTVRENEVIRDRIQLTSSP